MLRKLFFASAFAVLAAATPLPAQFIVPAGKLPLPRAFHGAVTLGDYTYVFGGSAAVDKVEQVPNSVMKAKIDAAGNIGAWEFTRSLPQPRYYISNATLVLSDVVYIVGGSDGANGASQDTVLWTRPGESGHLEPWRTSSSFGSRLNNTTAVSTPGYIHIVGGYSSTGTMAEASVSSAVISGRILPDGSISEWIKGPPLPRPIWYHHAQVSQGRVYAWGGLTNTDYTKPEPSSSVFSAPILASGLIGTWTTEKVTLPKPFYAGCSSVAGPYLMTFSASYGRTELSNDVWWTYVTREGIQPWQRQPTQIPMNIYHAIAPDYRRGAIYVSGGRTTRNSPKLGDILAFRLTDGARQSAVETWTSERAAHSTAIASVTTGGNYSYQAAAAAPTGALPGFLSVDRARAAYAQNPAKPLVLYFNVEGAKPCADQRALLADPAARSILDKGSFAWVNALEHPQLNQQLGVYRVPTWIFYDRNGEVKTRVPGVMSVAEIESTVTALSQ